MPRVAIQGERGSYSELAASRYFGSAEMMNCTTFTEAFSAVGKGADYAVVPIENSIEGVVTQVCDLLISGRLHVIGEHILRIEHCLMANEGVAIGDVKTVYSHPQALAQSRKRLEELGVEMVPFSDTAGAVRMIKERGLRDAAGVAGRYAAEVYGMKVLMSNLETRSHNYTRFFVLSGEQASHTGSDSKTAMGFITKNVPGGLYKALSSFAENGIDMTYLQSRPVPRKPWDYGFYVECTGSLEDTKLKEAVASLSKNTEEVRILGSYASARKVF